jgi:hypothetical protein
MTQSISSSSSRCTRQKRERKSSCTRKREVAAIKGDVALDLSHLTKAKRERERAPRAMTCSARISKDKDNNERAATKSAAQGSEAKLHGSERNHKKQNAYKSVPR